MLDFHVGGLLLAAVGGAIGKFAADWTIAAAVFAAILLLSLLVGYIRRSATQYKISDRRLYIRRGLLTRHEHHTTLDRVQNVEAKQTLFERLLGIGTVDFDTAATDDSVFAFTGIARPRRVLHAIDRAIDARASSEDEGDATEKPQTA